MKKLKNRSLRSFLAILTIGIFLDSSAQKNVVWETVELTMSKPNPYQLKEGTQTYYVTFDQYEDTELSGASRTFDFEQRAKMFKQFDYSVQIEFNADPPGLEKVKNYAETRFELPLEKVEDESSADVVVAFKAAPWRLGVTTNFSKLPNSSSYIAGVFYSYPILLTFKYADGELVMYPMGSLDKTPGSMVHSTKLVMPENARYNSEEISPSGLLKIKSNESIVEHLEEITAMTESFSSNVKVPVSASLAFLKSSKKVDFSDIEALKGRAKKALESIEENMSLPDESLTKEIESCAAQYLQILEEGNYKDKKDGRIEPVMAAPLFQSSYNLYLVTGNFDKAEGITTQMEEWKPALSYTTAIMKDSMKVRKEQLGIEE
ncbi:MAG: hypothetical protein JXQ90_09290 [Cyclobacteriaceae bacterium]